MRQLVVTFNEEDRVEKVLEVFTHLSEAISRANLQSLCRHITVPLRTSQHCNSTAAAFFLIKNVD